MDNESFLASVGNLPDGLVSHIVPADFVLVSCARSGITMRTPGDSYVQPDRLVATSRAFALKTTLPFLLLAIASLSWAIYRWVKDREARFLWMLVPFLVYTVFVLGSRIDIGVRYYLPAYPFLFILGGALLAQAPGSRQRGGAVLLVAIALMAWIGFEAVRAFPNQVSYMNQLAVARPHWWYLSDSNVEWGDEARAVGQYLRERGERSVYTFSATSSAASLWRSTWCLPTEGTEPSTPVMWRLAPAF